jgi:ribosomal protein S18 acetylase RimI-like enzyme
MLELRGVPFPPAATPAPPGIEFVAQTKPYGVEITAMRGTEEVGICLYMMLSRWTDHPDAGRIGYIGWLFVEETMRRRGLARALLTHALNELAQEGCDGCWLTTGTDNWEAQPLYLSLGFEVVDSSAAYRKTSGG